MTSMTNPYQTPSAELDAGRARAPVVRSLIARFLLAVAASTVVGLLSGGTTGAFLTMAWQGNTMVSWPFGVVAGLVLGGLGGLVVGTVLGLVAQTRASSRAVAIVGGVLGGLWALFFGGLGSIPMNETLLIASGAAFSALVGGAVGAALAVFLKRNIGPAD